MQTLLPLLDKHGIYVCWNVGLWFFVLSVIYSFLFGFSPILQFLFKILLSLLVLLLLFLAVRFVVSFTRLLFINYFTGSTLSFTNLNSILCIRYAYAVNASTIFIQRNCWKLTRWKDGSPFLYMGDFGNYFSPHNFPIGRKNLITFKKA